MEAGAPVAAFIRKPAWPPLQNVAHPVQRLDIVDERGPAPEAHLGRETPDGQNQYARLVGSPKLFSVPQIWARVVNRLVFQPPYPRLYDTDIEDRELLTVGKQDVGRIEVTVDGETRHYVWDSVSDAWFLFDQAVDATEDDDIQIPENLWNDRDVLLENPDVIETVTENLKDPEEYGLDPPKVSVWVGFNQNKAHEFFLGDLTPDGRHRYAQTSGQTELFTVTAEWAEAIEKLATDPPVPEGEGS